MLTSSSSSLKHLWCLLPVLVVAATLVLLYGTKSSSYLLANLACNHECEKEINSRNYSKTHIYDGLDQKPGKNEDQNQHVTRTQESEMKKYNNNRLKMVEADLAEARDTVKEYPKWVNVTKDPDYVPNGPMYWNPKLFHRSYLEMEKRMKVYVYEEGEPPVFHSGPCKDIYAIEGIFIEGMETSGFRTFDPNKAHLFFLPFSVTQMTQQIFVPGSFDWTPMLKATSDYINVISQKHAYWNRTLGADHFMLACHDIGPAMSSANSYLHKNAIRALCNSNSSEQFNPSRDVSIPEINLPSSLNDNFIGGPPPSKRSTLVFYAGEVHGPIRPILLHHWENTSDPDVQISKYLPQNISYYGMMRKSRYCICPSGFEVASPRMVESLYLGCVPVLIKDSYVIPFSDVLNWETFAVIVKVEDIPNLKRILMEIPMTEYVKMQERGIQMRRHFEVNLQPKRYDVFHMILHSVWLRRLNVRFRDG